jgi:hypothetical protein
VLVHIVCLCVCVCECVRNLICSDGACLVEESAGDLIEGDCEPIANQTCNIRGGVERGGGAIRVVMSNQDHKDFRGNPNSTDSSFRKGRGIEERKGESEIRDVGKNGDRWRGKGRSKDEKRESTERMCRCSTLPAIGTRNGSVQNTALLISCMSEALTASANCIGRSDGTTLKCRGVNLVIKMGANSVGKCCHVGLCLLCWHQSVLVFFFRFRMSRRVVLLDIM